MAVKRSKGTGKEKKEPGAGTDRTAKAFDTALQHVETIARERIGQARNPVDMGLKMAGQIRVVADNLESEVMAESLSLTEASYSCSDIVGVGIGVL